MKKQVFLSKHSLVQLYSQGKSMFEISQIKNCSIHKVAYWMEKYGIKRRNLNDAIYLKLNPDGDPFKIKTNLSSQEAFLFGLGIGIYWGEGNKVSPHSIRVANTDPYMLKSFITFLTEICGVKKEKIGYSVVCFNDNNPEEACNFWAKALDVHKKRFGKVVQIPPQGKGNYRKKSQFGVCTVTVNNIKFKKWIMIEINKAAGMAQW